jgi:hypothetical protein
MDHQGQPTTPTGRFVNIHNGSVIVEVIGQGQYRLGETRRTVTIYSRDGSLFVRNSQEFNRIFKELK